MHLWEPQLFLINLKLLHLDLNLQEIHRQERFGRRNMAIGMIKTEQAMVFNQSSIPKYWKGKKVVALDKQKAFLFKQIEIITMVLTKL